MDLSKRIDFHLHTTGSDGTDTPAELLTRVKASGITHFSVTDHDAVAGCVQIRSLLQNGDPAFVCGVEFSCQDEEGKYHILGYGYDPSAPSVLDLVKTGHDNRLDRVQMRLEFIDKEFGFRFSKEEREALFALPNPGKPHIAGLMVKHGFAPTIDDAFDRYLNKCKGKGKHVRPEDAIAAILAAGGVPVLAHPSFGSGNELIVGKEMERRLVRLISFGLQGVEAFYSRFTEERQREMLAFADRFDLYVTAGSDYHGANKTIPIGLTNLDRVDAPPSALCEFLKRVGLAF